MPYVNGNNVGETVFFANPDRSNAYVSNPVKKFKIVNRTLA